LAVQRLVISVLGHQHLREQAGRRYALVDHVRLARRLHQALTLRASPLAAHMAFNGEHVGLVVQLLGDVLADAFHLAAAVAHRVVGLVPDLPARQVWRQRLALGGLLVARCGLRAKCLQFGLHGCQVSIDRVFQQIALLGAEVLTRSRA
jgi:hypothetical protein